jgi:hypothetical protein
MVRCPASRPPIERFGCSLSEGVGNLQLRQVQPLSVARRAGQGGAKTELAPPRSEGRERKVGSGTRVGRVRSGGQRLRREDGDLRFLGQHDAKDLLQSQQVDARIPTLEVMAGAMPRTGVETDVMGVVVAAEGEREMVRPGGCRLGPSVPDGTGLPAARRLGDDRIAPAGYSCPSDRHHRSMVQGPDGGHASAHRATEVPQRCTAL